MFFNQAIKIKVWVNHFNKTRKSSGFAVIKFDCQTYSDGRWAVDLELSQKGCFFSDEMKTLSALAANLDIMFFVGSNQVSPVLHFQ